MKERDIRDAKAFAQYLTMVREDVANYFSDASRFLGVRCPACGGSDHTVEFDKIGFRYVSCRACATLFVNPRPGKQMLKEFYLNAPSSLFWIKGFFLPMVEARREKIFTPRAEYVAGRVAPAADGSVADVGAGFGLFLEELGKLWPRARLVAIEPSAEMATVCRSKGLEVAESTIEEVVGHAARFDLVTAFELLEHLFEPRELVAQAFRLLRPGGHLVATTLSGEGFDIQVLWARSKSVFPPHHLNFLNPRSLARLCEDIGFVVEELSTPGQLDWDIVEQTLANEPLEGARFWSLVARQGSDVAKHELQSWLARHGLSSHMRIVARRP